jgi:hypothetical protein
VDWKVLNSDVCECDLIWIRTEVSRQPMKQIVEKLMHKAPPSCFFPVSSKNKSLQLAGEEQPSLFCHSEAISKLPVSKGNTYWPPRLPQQPHRPGDVNIRHLFSYSLESRNPRSRWCQVFSEDSLLSSQVAIFLLHLPWCLCVCIPGVSLSRLPLIRSWVRLD